MAASPDRKRETSFWGDPTYKPADKDVASFVKMIRELTKKAGRTRKLKVATASMHAICAFIAGEFGPREALALLDKLRCDVAGVSE